MQAVLLNHPRPYLDETLTSWLWRLAQCNYIHSPALLLPHLQEMSSYTTPVMPHIMHGLHKPALFMALAEMTNTAVETIYQHTLHRFAHLLIPPTQEAVQLQVSSNTTLALLPNRLTKDFYTPRFAWCPACLGQARYVRLHWHIPLVTCCEIHHCWLLEACPTCQQLKETDILGGYCTSCHFRLDQAVSIPVPTGDGLLLMTSTVKSWLYKHTETLPVKVPDAPVAALLRVLQGLRYNVQRAGDSWDFHHIPPGIPIPALDILRQRYLSLFERGCLYGMCQ